MSVAMTREILDSIRESFDDAFSLGEAERASMLARLESDRPEVARAVRRLLRSAESGSIDAIVRFADDGASGGGFDPEASLLTGGQRVITPEGEATVVGVLSSPARFGDTEVYRVRLESTGEDAALKILVGGHVSRERLRRFRLEAQVQAACRHPWIARVVAAGPVVCPSGLSLPSILMELIEGEPLDAYAARAGWEAACRTLVRTGEAVHHANLRGVVHRDLKPSNIMVAADGTPRVLDFGVARLIEGGTMPGPGSLMTQGVAVVGTLSYMAPEQISPVASEVDLRADVYALGVMLHELVFGGLPVRTDGMTVAEAGRAKLCEVPKRRPPGPARRVGLFVARRPVAAGSVGLAIAVVVASLVVGVSQQRRIVEERNLAESRFRAAQSFTRWIIFDLSDEITGDPAYRDFQRRLIDRARSVLAELEVGSSSTGELRLEAASAHVQLGEILTNALGDYEGGRREFNLARDLIADIEWPLARAMRAWCWFRLGHVSVRPEGETSATMTYAALDELIALEAPLGQVARYWHWRAWVSCYASRRFLDEGRPPGEVRAVLADAANAAGRAAALEPANPRYGLTIAEAAFWTAHAELDLDGPGLLESTERAIGAARALAENGQAQGVPATVRALALHARALARRGRTDDALAVIAGALQSARALADADPMSKPAFRQVEMLHHWAAEICERAADGGRTDLREEAALHARRCLELHERRLSRGWVDPGGEGHYLADYRARAERLRAEPVVP